MKLTDYHAKYFAYELTKRSPSNSLEKLTPTLSNAQIDLNPHQIEAALFAFKSPLSKGAILADEVGLGKTIEAGLVMAQKWAEKKRKLLLITPANLRKQWYQELLEKFFLPATILERKSFDQIIKEGNLNPFNQESVVICSYHFARNKASYINADQIDWDLVVIDEAHRLRNVYKATNKIAKDLKKAIEHSPKILLTATPLQNSLLELYGLVSIIDDHIFGDIDSFKVNYTRLPKDEINDSENRRDLVNEEKFNDLKKRLEPVCIRTLRKQVMEYIKYTKRIPHTEDYYPGDDEMELYEKVSEYLRRDHLYALPYSQRQLITLILRKILASSSFAIASTLKKMAYRLEMELEEAIDNNNNKLDVEDLTDEYEGIDETSDEWIDSEEDDSDENEVKRNNKSYSEEQIDEIRQEKEELEHFAKIAGKIWKNSKGDSLLTALKNGFNKMQELGGARKAVIFTESRITQNYLYNLLSENGYQDKIVMFNGTNADEKAKEIYISWLDKNKDTDKITGSRSSDTRAALIDYFRESGEIMIATEAGAEGVNLQFCSLVINYDLPWNPQRIEQRIGRCHRYGQKYDVVVINFINRKNAADQRIYQLLSEKFQLFQGVFGASDEVLGTIESGVDFEKRIAQIYQTCRSTEEINESFDDLQEEMEVSISDHLDDTKKKLLENFDSDVHERLKMNREESGAYLDQFESMLWQITQYILQDDAEYSKDEYAFTLNRNPFPNEGKIPNGPYRIGKHIDDTHIFRPSHPLAEHIINSAKSKETPPIHLEFDYSNSGIKSTDIEESLMGKKGIIQVRFLSVDAFEIEDHILFGGITEDGKRIDQEVINKLFKLIEGEIIDKSIDIKSLEKEMEELERNLFSDIDKRNGLFFETELDKLDYWEMDKKQGLELSLKELDKTIKEKKKEVRLAANLPEKLKLQREGNNLEKKYRKERDRLLKAEKEIEEQKDKLIDTTQSRMERRVTRKDLFTISFNVI
jgi:ERCC4-related helicase